MRTALAERADGIRIVSHVAGSRFVAGQAKAVVELLSGRPNLPVTSWQPEAVSGHRGKPTLLSNAETWARVGTARPAWRDGVLLARDPRRARRHPADLELARAGPVVREAEYGARLRDFLPSGLAGRPALVGGFHGSWATWETLASARVSVAGMRTLGTPLGAGVVLSTPRGDVPGDADEPDRRLPRRPERGPLRTVLQRAARPREAVSSVVDGARRTGPRGAARHAWSSGAARVPTPTAPSGWSGRC